MLDLTNSRLYDILYLSEGTIKKVRESKWKRLM